MRGGVHRIVVNADSLDNVSVVKKKLKAELSQIKSKKPVIALDWKELTPGLVQSIAMDLISGVIFYLILIIVVAFSIMNTFLMSVFERTKEFGVLIKELRLLARAVFVIDRQGVIRYIQLVQELSQEPDYESILSALKETA